MSESKEESTSVHDLFDFMRQITDEMDAEYSRIQKRSTEDQGTAGDQGEENWATLLRGWLPTTYEVITKGRIIGHSGSISPQIDIVILSSSYPQKMRDKKLFLAGGVIAAFECKNTLKAAHLTEAVETSRIVKSLCVDRTGTPYEELQAPIIYGVLAHSHSWKGPKSNPLENVESALLTKEKEAGHPKELIDLVCVADLATWTLGKSRYIGTNFQSMPNYRPVVSSLLCHSNNYNAENNEKPFTPIGCMVGTLFTKLAYEDASAENMAQYYVLVGLSGSGKGKLRGWSELVFSNDVRNRLASGSYPRSSSRYDKWGISFI